MFGLAVSAVGAGASQGADARSSKSGYTIKVSNSGLSGDPGYFYEGGSLNVTVKKLRGTSNAKVTIRMIPHARGRSSRPLHSRVGKTVTGLAPSAPGKTRFIVTVEGIEKPLRRTIRVRPNPADLP
ncbi:hypothetical protein [Patulibacter sp. SYSU D01012]|uniref:hypothetical protein n=1 Tax=Patulibacter sp. SYSU D01012 TaxID=2817381 RepID=UPI001B311844|nr:hypothetical protein [Patulibacter sp. SYSU D01012]